MSTPWPARYGTSWPPFRLETMKRRRRLLHQRSRGRAPGTCTTSRSSHRLSAHGKLPSALFASTSHMVDVGGRGMGPDSRQVYEEGIYIPLMYFAREGTVEDAGRRHHSPERSRIDTGDRRPFFSLGVQQGRCQAARLSMMDEFHMDDARCACGTLHSRTLAAKRALEAIRQASCRAHGVNEMMVDGYDEPVKTRGDDDDRQTTASTSISAARQAVSALRHQRALLLHGSVFELRHQVHRRAEGPEQRRLALGYPHQLRLKGCILNAKFILRL